MKGRTPSAMGDVPLHSLRSLTGHLFDLCSCVCVCVYVCVCVWLCVLGASSTSSHSGSFGSKIRQRHAPAP